jgi:hypothetical protein
MVGSFVVEKNVPVPPKRALARLYPWPEMQPGDSFEVPCKPGPERVRVRSSLAGSAKSAGLRVRTRCTKRGVRVWLIERLPGQGSVDLAKCAVDWERCEFVVAGARRRVQRQVWIIFATLARRGGRLVTRERLFEALYADDPDGGPLTMDGTLNVRMHALRRACPWPIRTIWATGFILEGFRPPKPVGHVPLVAGIDRTRLIAGR